MNNEQIKSAVESILHNEMIQKLENSLVELRGARDMFPGSEIDSEIDAVNSKIAAIKNNNIHWEFFANTAEQIPAIGKSAHYDGMVIDNCFITISSSDRWIKN